MKKFVLVTLIAGLTTAALYASQAAPADRVAVEKQLAATEQKINDAFSKQDVAGMKANVADDASAIDPGGVTSVSEFFKQLPTMDVKLTDVKMSDFKYHWVDANNVVLTYTLDGEGHGHGAARAEPDDRVDSVHEAQRQVARVLSSGNASRSRPTGGRHVKTSRTSKEVK